ncbi:TPA: hypothetical protein ACPFPT_001135 [Escherichia coli]
MDAYAIAGLIGVSVFLVGFVIALLITVKKQIMNAYDLIWLFVIIIGIGVNIYKLW